MPKEILRMDKITKIYPNGFMANKEVTFSVDEGEIHALLGENGAGKTTLMNILFGLESHEGGSIFLNGQPVEITDPLNAIKHGIGMVHQHFKLVPSLSIAENVILGIEPHGKLGTLSFKKALELTRNTAEKYNIHIDPMAKVRNVSVGMMQQVELLKILVRGAKIIVLDEPTAVLTPQETQGLFRELKVLRDNGHTIIFISHKLNEVMEICDRFTVLRNGELVGVKQVCDSSTGEITNMMIGREVDLKIEKHNHPVTEARLLVEHMNVTTPSGKKRVDDVSFIVHGGQVMGIAAIEGNGQNEIAETICGIQPIQQGNVVMNGKNINHLSIRGRREMGMSIITEDRYRYGCSRVSSIQENLLADRYFKPPYSKGVFINRKACRQAADGLVKEFKVKCKNIADAASSLSGGNAQKMIVARELSASPKVVVANQPTRGIDVGSAELVRQSLVEMTEKNNAAVLLISADLTELLEVSDEIIVIHSGKIVAYFPDASKVSEFELGEYMLGSKEMDEQQLKEVIR
ncbi:MAG: ABC transporter ATP-binding protein [Clostridia bacterium]